MNSWPRVFHLCIVFVHFLTLKKWLLEYQLLRNYVLDISEFKYHVFLALIYSISAIFYFLAVSLNKEKLRFFSTITFICFTGLYFVDETLRGNYYTMSFFLFMTHSLFKWNNGDGIKLNLVCFYFGAGLLKINKEWISGGALLRDTFIPLNLYPMISIWVIVFELILIWALLWKKNNVFYYTLISAFLFHVFSWHQVGHFYPMIMMSFLVVFLISEEFSFKWRASYITSLVFLVFQIYPLFYQRDLSLTGEFRTFKLNMFDATTQCWYKIFAYDESTRVEIPIIRRGPVRSQCDPYLLYRKAKVFCTNYKVNMSLMSKRTSDKNYRPIVQQEDICNLDYNYFSPNDWIKS